MIRTRFNTYDQRKALSVIENQDNNQGYIRFYKARAFLESVALSASCIVEDMEKAALTGNLSEIEESLESFSKSMGDARDFYIPDFEYK